MERGRVTGLANWNDRSHWAHDARPCRHCGKPTNLRDDSRKPSHKVCAEEQQATANYRKDAA